MLREVGIRNSSPPLSKPYLPKNSEVQPFPLPVLPRPDIPVRGRLAHFVEQWEELKDNKWVLSIVRNGFKIPFKSPPPLSVVPINLSQSSYPLLREYKIHSSNGTKFGFHTKSKEVRFDTNTKILLYMYGIFNSTSTCLSSSLSSTLTKSINTSKRKVSTSKTSQYSTFTPGSYQAIRDKKISQNIADFVFKSRQTSTQKV